MNIENPKPRFGLGALLGQKAAEVAGNQAALKSDKGLKGGSCNLTACQRPGANFFNKSTRKYYCADCAREINWPGGRADTMALYGTPLLCEYEA